MRLGNGRACVRARVFAFQASPPRRAQRTTRRAFRPSGAFSHSSRGLSFMRWELDTHACVRVFAYVDIAIALLSVAGPLLSLRRCSSFYEMGNGCACVNARAQHEYPPTKHPPSIMGFLDHRNRFARFQASEPNVGLCNLKATVARVNLTAANVVALCVTHNGGAD